MSLSRQPVHIQKRSISGTGLSLAIAKKYIELHRGGIWVRVNLRRTAGLICNTGETGSRIYPEGDNFHGYTGCSRDSLMLSYELESRKVEIDFKSEWSFQYRITADEELIKGILINIINNAIRYSTEKSKVMIELKSREGKYVISVGNRWVMRLRQQPQPC